ncbi:MAG: hypothetical protein ACRD4O_17945 [Bryobacteraceae bacterium]
MPQFTKRINESYDSLMFAKSAPAARKAARELVSALLGEEALKRPLAEALRECCRLLRPAEDPREQERFEAEFVELGVWPNASQNASRRAAA